MKEEINFALLAVVVLLMTTVMAVAIHYDIIKGRQNVKWMSKPFVVDKDGSYFFIGVDENGFARIKSER